MSIYQEQVEKKWQKSINIANQKKLTKFIFNVNGDMYFSEWVKNQWSFPIFIYQL